MMPLCTSWVRLRGPVLQANFHNRTDTNVKQHNGNSEQCQLMKLEEIIFMRLFIWKEFKNIVPFVMNITLTI